MDRPEMPSRRFEPGGHVPDEIRRMDAFEEEHLTEFRSFYTGLRVKRCWFMFFTAGLLNIVTKALEFMPEDEPVVLVASALPEEELDWLRHERASYPIHHIPVLVDDKTVWEFLFSVADEDFGWVDIDCFILDNSLLAEVQDGGESVAMSGPFSFAPLPLLRTHLLWVASAAVGQLATAVPTSPATYSYLLTHAQRYPEHSFCRIIRPEHLNHISKVIELDASGRPSSPQEGILELYSNGITLHSTERRWAEHVFSGNPRRLFPIYDTLVLAQLIWLSMGYQPRVLRGGSADISSLAVHWKSISYHRRIGLDLGDLTAAERKRLPTHHRWTLLADALLMYELAEAGNLPGNYEPHMRFLSDRLAQEGFTIGSARRALSRYLVDNGVDGEWLSADERWRFLRPGG